MFNLCRKAIPAACTVMMVSLFCNVTAAEGDIPLSPQKFFQLRGEELGLCLTLSDTEGSLIDCNNESGDIADLTVFRLHGTPGNEQIELFASGKCLDREHCHSDTSNLRKSDCSHCGAIHWDLRQDGTLREDNGANCIYVVESANIVAVHHSTDGCSSFNPVVIGDRLNLKSVSHGDCLSNGVFGDCALAPRFALFGLPYNYQLRDTISGHCLDREHCHFSTSNIRLFDCSHCGAIHWSVVNTQVGEDNMKNCVNRGPGDSAVLNHCSDGWEKFTYEILATEPLKDTNSQSFITGFPIANVLSYVADLSKLHLRGIRLYPDKADGTTRFEFVHELPVSEAFSVDTNLGLYHVRYWVGTIATKVAHNVSVNPRELMDSFQKSPKDKHAIYMRYGVVDLDGSHLGEDDGLRRLFVVDQDTPGVVPESLHDVVLLQLAHDFKANKWWFGKPCVHQGKNPQLYYNFDGDSSLYQALYWSNVVKENQ